MFVKNTSSSQRVCIIDVSHMFFKYAFGGASALSATIKVDGVLTRVDTTLPTYVIKQIHRWADGGINPTVVCFDGAGCSRSRKLYFKKGRQDEKTQDIVAVDYKGSRDIQDGKFYDGINITFNCLLRGGVCCLKADGYEADDLIKAAIDKAKVVYPNLPIDVITGDADLIPLVDDQVSVFYASRKTTWAEDKSIEKKHYIQLTPNNYQAFVEDMGAYKNLHVPYNTLLLTKLLRGDKSDNIPRYEGVTPTLYNQLIDGLANSGYDLSDLFRYDSPTQTICYRGSEQPIPEELIESTPKEQKMIKFGEPPCLTKMCNILSEYFPDDVLDHIRFIYNGINLNGHFVGLPDGYNRRPANVKADIKGYSHAKLQESVSEVQINLPML